MKFIRAFWGDLSNFNERHKHEIIEVSKNKNLNEMVYVWGVENNKFIKSLGYETILMSDNPTEYGDHYLYNSSTYMIHKLEAIKMGIKMFEEVIFLDWDCKQLKPIDKDFFYLLKLQDQEIQMPLYLYPKNYSDIILNEWGELLDSERKKYVLKQQIFLQKHHYEWGDSFVTPNAGFIYCSNASIINDLISISYEHEIGIATEEMAFVEYTKKFVSTLEEYVYRFEPLVCDAKYETHFNQKDLNKFISKLIKKNLYFIHE
jgi:hypothetical protein